MSCPANFTSGANNYRAAYRCEGNNLPTERIIASEDPIVDTPSAWDSTFSRGALKRRAMMLTQRDSISPHAAFTIYTSDERMGSAIATAYGILL